MDMWDTLQYRLKQANLRIDMSLARRDRRAFHIAAQDRRRIVARLTEIYLRGMDRAPYCVCMGTGCSDCGGDPYAAREV